MANHFRKPEDGQDEFVTPSADPVAASHFALSPDAAPAPAASSLDPGDTGAFLASAGVTTVPAALNVPEVPAAPDVVATPDPEVLDSLRRRVISLEAGHVVRDQERGGYGNYGA